ncbi:unnamed protein product [Sphacelaria rigidula]
MKGQAALALVAATMGCFLTAEAALDVGESHVCATVGSTPKCWGANQWGQLGRGDTEDTGDEADEMGDSLIVVDMGTGETVSDFALGGEFTCAILDSGSIKCFGYNTEGQLGQGNTSNVGDEADEMGDALLVVDLGTGVTVTEVTTGCQHSCALIDDGDVKCFGYNNYGQLGQGTTDNIGDDAGEMGDDLAVVDLGDLSATSIAAGCDFTCAIVDDGSVMCWGRNTWGQLGTGDDQDVLDEAGESVVAVDLDGSSASAIAAGEGHVCALLDDSSVKCWGRNNNGQLGQGDNVDRGDTADSLGANLAAIEFGDSDVPTAIDCGSFFTCALMDDSSIKCFGDNGDGQLGIGSDVSEVGTLPTDMGANLTAVDLGGSASEIAVGGSSMCAVLDDESVKCWGRGRSGQLGQGNDDSVGSLEGELAELTAVDIGSDTLASSSLPTPAPLVNETATAPSMAPTAAPAGMVASSVTPTAAPTGAVTSSVSPTVASTGMVASSVSPTVASTGMIDRGLASSAPTAAPQVTTLAPLAEGETYAPTAAVSLAPGETAAPAVDASDARARTSGGYYVSTILACVAGVVILAL